MRPPISGPICARPGTRRTTLWRRLARRETRREPRIPDRRQPRPPYRRAYRPMRRWRSTRLNCSAGSWPLMPMVAINS